MSNKLNLLFICSRNQWRSPTAETIWRNSKNYNSRSAGTSPNAKRTVRSTDIRWADIIFVMESKHKNRLIAKFNRMLGHKRVHVLDIPDEYQFMDSELIVELKISVKPFLS
ncbi:MAG: phosphotyrosine protein phosphatase [Alcanivoracaceae bacterium]|nr:phosphotyrosine protein phosphatase [Alcanivoracaceae bacterium]